MSFEQVIAELPKLTFEQRQRLIHHVIALDDPPLLKSEEALIEARLAGHRANPNSSVPLAKMKKTLHAAKHDRHWRKRI